LKAESLTLLLGKLKFESLTLLLDPAAAGKLKLESLTLLLLLLQLLAN